MKPLVSVGSIVLALLFIVFIKMELRRVGYELLKVGRLERQLRDSEREISIQIAQVLRPDRLAQVAQTRLTLVPPKKGQVIHMTDSGVAIEQ